MQQKKRKIIILATQTDGGLMPARAEHLKKILLSQKDNNRHRILITGEDETSLAMSSELIPEEYIRGSVCTMGMNAKEAVDQSVLDEVLYAPNATIAKMARISSRDFTTDNAMSLYKVCEILEDAPNRDIIIICNYVVANYLAYFLAGNDHDEREKLGKEPLVHEGDAIVKSDKSTDIIRQKTMELA